MRKLSTRSVRNIAAGVLATGLLVGTFLTPAGAHYAGQNDSHVFNTHVRALADQRYDRLGVGDHVVTRYFTNATAVTTSALAGAPTSLGSFAFNVGAGQNRAAVVTYSAESVCFGASGWCVVDVLVDGSTALDLPNANSEFAFDSTDSGTADSGGWEGLTMTRAAENLGPGSHTIELVAYVTDPGISLRLDDAFARLDILRL